MGVQVRCTGHNNPMRFLWPVHRADGRVNADRPLKRQFKSECPKKEANVIVGNSGPLLFWTIATLKLLNITRSTEASFCESSFLVLFTVPMVLPTVFSRLEELLLAYIYVKNLIYT